MTRKFDVEELLEFSNEVKRVKKELSDLLVNSQKIITKADMQKLRTSLKKFDEFRVHLSNKQEELFDKTNGTEWNQFTGYDKLEEEYGVIDLFFGDKIEL